MARIHPYLLFNGNCREAMYFYQKCLGGRLDLQTIGDSLLKDDMNKVMKDCILQATLQSDLITIVGTDMVSEMGLIRGNTLSMCIICTQKTELKRYFTKLSRGGEVLQPIILNYWGNIVGELNDRYGYHWILQTSREYTKDKM